jgi:hypothetical protein
MFRLAVNALSVLLLASSAYDTDGMIEAPSAHTPHATADRRETLAKERGMKVLGRVDHAAGALESVRHCVPPS